MKCFRKWNLNTSFIEQFVWHILEDVYFQILWLKEMQIDECVHILVDGIIKFLMRSEENLIYQKEKKLKKKIEI
jgi:hypothetical protein